LFAALPTGGFDRGIIFALIPIISALVVTLAAKKYLDQMRWEFATAFSAAGVLSLLSALVAGAIAFFLSSLASGALGPGRFSEVGVNPWMFSLVIFLEVLIPVFLVSLVVARPRSEASRK
jgi:thiamine transporter ThiT